MAAARCDGRIGVDGGTGAGWHRLCRGIRRARHLRPVRHHGRAAGLRTVRSQSDPGAGAGLFAGCNHPRRRAAALGGRPATCHRAGRHDGPGVGCPVRRGWRSAAWLRHRVAVQADPLRLHERHRTDGDRQPVAGVVRFRRRCPWTAGRVTPVRVGFAGRQDEPVGAGHRRRHAPDDSSAQAPFACAGRVDRRRSCDPGCHLAGSGFDYRGLRGCARARHAAAGPARFLPAVDRRQRHHTRAARRTGGGTDLVCRHQRVVADLRRADSLLRRFEPGNGGSGCGQRSRRSVPGLSDQRQCFTHTGGRGRRRQDTTHRGWWARWQSAPCC